MIPWPWLIVPLFVGVPLGAIVMGRLCRLGCSARHEAIRHLERLYHLIDNAEMCDFSNGVTYRNIDEGTVYAETALANARRFLDQYNPG